MRVSSICLVANTKGDNMDTKNKQKMEFSKKLVVVSWIITIIWISLSFLLAFFGKDANSEVTVALITESFGMTLAYFIYQATLKISRNKYGIDCDGVPYSVKQKIGSIVEESENNEEGVG